MANDKRSSVDNLDRQNRQVMGRLRFVAWFAAAVLLVGAFVATQLTEEFNWTAGDFIIAGILLFGSLALYELVARSKRSSPYRAATGLALVGVVLLLWINGAVGITDSDADFMYIGVVTLGIVGGALARFRPRGMAITLAAMALGQLLVGIIAILSGIVPEHNSTLEVLGISTVFAGIFLASALLYRQAQDYDPESESK